MEHPIVISSSNIIGNINNNQINILSIISRYIASGPGQAKLAASMAMPLRRRLDYQSVAGKCFLVEPMPSGAAVFYSGDINKYLYDDIIIDSSGNIGRRETFSNRKIRVPTFNIFKSPTFKMSDITQQAFPTIDKAVQKAREEIMNQEDSDIFRALDHINES